MSDPKKTPPAVAKAATPVLAYAPGAPVQSLPVRVDGKVETIDLVPGLIWPLPADHKLTRSMQAAGLLVPDTAKGDSK